MSEETLEPWSYSEFQARMKGYEKARHTRILKEMQIKPDVAASEAEKEGCVLCGSKRGKLWAGKCRACRRKLRKEEGEHGETEVSDSR